jgi:hypothetical protein
MSSCSRTTTITPSAETSTSDSRNLEERDKVIAGWHYKIRTTSTEARLVSRKFTIEYDKRPAINNIIEAFECELEDLFGEDCFDAPDPLPSSLVSHTTTLHINLVLCHGTYDELYGCPVQDLRVPSVYTHYESWLQLLLMDLPRLKEMTMNISCGNLECVTALQAPHHSIWPNDARLSQITLLRPRYDYILSEECWAEDHKREAMELVHSQSPSGFYLGRETMATWTRAQGWQTDAEVIERCRKEEAKHYW